MIIWIVWCMFFRERHKSELYQYDISDIRHRNCILAEEEANANKKEKEIYAGIFILPSHKQKVEEYDKRPDYPESPPPKADKLIEIFDDNNAEVHYQDGIYEVDSSAPYHSDV